MAERRPVTERRPMFGGQAVLEGVMMRGPRRYAVAVRRPDGSIALREQDVAPLGERWPLLKLPVIRGIAGLFQALALGLEALTFSASQLAETEEQKPGKWETGIAMVVAILAAVGLFVFLPTWLVRFFEGFVGGSLALNLLEGFIRFLVLLAYTVGISLIPDIGRVLQYHGAEHKAIHAWENGKPLEVASARPYPTMHPRCGTSFLLFLVILKSLIFAFMGWPDFWLRITMRLLFFPIVVGLAYEVVRVSGKLTLEGRGGWLQPIILPGLWFQRITTREPDDAQIEVALKALERVVPEGSGFVDAGKAAGNGGTVQSVDATAG